MNRASASNYDYFAAVTLTIVFQITGLASALRSAVLSWGGGGDGGGCGDHSIRGTSAAFIDFCECRAAQAIAAFEVTYPLPQVQMKQLGCED